ncbi:MAG TPA: pilus assembly protein TadG-related protein [Devosia sp.]|nr:pilus assembly protein TadG-related protein [Devosia sp.]
MRKSTLGLRDLLRRLHRDERGVVSILGTFLILIGLGLSVLVIDVGHLYLTKRRLQATVDAAALAAAGNPANATTIAQSVLAQGGFATTELIVQSGLYTPDLSLAVAARLNTNSDAPANAVRVTNRIATPDFFAAIFSEGGKANITATATAAQTPIVSFSAGTGLAQLDGGVLNTVLGKLLGGNLSLSLINWQGLAGANVDALSLLNQIASQVGVTAGTYGDLASANVTAGQVIAAAQTALNVHPGGNNTAALEALNLLSLQVPQGVSATLGSIIDTTLWQTRQVGSILQQNQGQTTINLLDTVSAMAQLYGSNHLVDLGAALSLPITNTTVSAYLSAGQPMASAALAPIGTTVSTSQVRLALTVTAADVNLGLASAKVTVPLYIQIAPGQARVATIPCQANGTMATIAATPAAANVQIGEVNQDQLQDFSTTPAPGPAAVVQLTILGIPLTIKASGSAAIATGATTDLNFTQTGIQSGALQTAFGSDGSQLIGGLANNLTLTVAGTGITGIVSGLVNSTVVPLLRPLLASILSALDPTVDNLLQTLGLQIGTIDVTVHGVSCGRATLVG